MTKLQKKIIAILCSVLLVIGVIPASVFADYNTIFSDVENNTVNCGIIYGASKYVLVGESGSIMTSTDAITWTKQTSPTTATLNDITYTGSKFIAIGSGGTIITSVDAVTWTSQTAVTTESLKSICIVYGSTYVVVGTNGCIMTSTNAINWTIQTSNTTNELNSVCFAYNKLVATGAAGTVITSPDAITWTARTSNTTSVLYSITYAASKFVAGGASGTIITSVDGATWTLQTAPTTSTIYNLKYINSQFYLLGSSGVILTSADAISWTAQSSTTTKALKRIIYANSKYVIVVNEAYNVLTSITGVSWTLRNTAVLPYLDEVIYANNQFLAVGDSGNIVTSSDGINWARQTTGIANRLYSIAYGNGIYVAVGSSGKILTSIDSITWTTQVSNTTNVLYKVKYTNNKFIAVGAGGKIITSSDGIIWTSQNSAVTNTLYSVTYAVSKYIAVGASGCIIYSPDAITWTSLTQGSSDYYDIAFGNYGFVIVGSLGAILQSSTGTTWTSRKSLLYLLNIDSITYSQGEYITAGGLGNIRNSKTGATWTTILNSSAYSLCSLAYGNSKYVAVGDNVTNFISDVTAPTITLSEQTTWTNGNVAVNTTFDDESGVVSKKWAAGTQIASYFTSAGNTFTGSSFQVPANGVYTVYAKDLGGLERVKTITVTKQDTSSPSITDVVTPTTWGTTNTISSTITDAQSGVAVQKYALGIQTASYFISNGNLFTGNSFTVSQIGTYTIYAKDNAGNTSIQTALVDRVDTTPPSISLDTTTTWGETNTLTADITDADSGVAIRKWAIGNLPASFFAISGTSFSGNNINVSKNGVYTIYAKDNAGNESVQTITASYIYEFQKLGEFSESFNELSVPSVGFNIDFNRVYQSSNKNTGMFGEGWTFNYEGSCKDYQYSYTDVNNITQTATIPNIKVVKMPDGSSIMFELAGGVYTPYNSRNTLVKNADNTFTLTTKDNISYNFNTSGYLVSMNDSNANTISINVDANGKIQSIVDSVNRQYIISYGNNGLVSSILDFSGRLVQYQYNGDKLLNIIDPMVQVKEQYEYDSAGFLCKVKDSYLNILEEITYDHTESSNKDRIQTITSVKGETTTYTYDNINNKVILTDSKDQVIYTYNDFMQLISKEDSTGSSTITYYNLLGDIHTVTDTNGNVTEYQFDSRGNITNVTNSDGTSEIRTYDIHNNMLTSEDSNGYMVFYEYDNSRNLVKTAQPKNGTDIYSLNCDQSKFIISQFVYNSNGSTNSKTDPDGTITIYTYDSNGNVIKESNSSTGITRSIYNNIGNLIQKILPAQYVPGNDGLNDSVPTNSYSDINVGDRYTYNANGYELTFIDSQNNSSTNTYDNHNKLIKYVSDSNVTRYIYDSHGWLTQEINPTQYNPAYDGWNNTPQTNTYSDTTAGNRYSYDIHGNLLTHVDSNNSNTTNTYDNKNQLLKTVSGSQITRYLYDNNGKTIQQISSSQYDPTKDGLNKPTPENTYTNSDGSQVNVGDRYTYNSNGNILTHIDSKNISSSYIYDENNKVLKFTNGIYVTRYLYNSDNKIIQQINPNQYISTSDGLNNATPVNTYNNASVGDRYTYDNNGNVLSHTDPAGYITYNTYDVNNKLIKTVCNNNVTRYVYNIMNQLMQTVYPSQYNVNYDGLNAVIPDNTYSDNTVGERYSYDVNGNILSYTDSTNKVTTNTFDLTNKLIKSVCSNNVTRYLYDAKGNLLQQINPEQYNATYDGLPSSNTYSDNTVGDRYTYNASGNVLTHTDANNQTITYTYNADGRLLTTTQANNTVFTNDNTTGNVNTEQFPSNVTNTITYNDDGTINNSSVRNNNNSQYGFDEQLIYNGYGAVDQFTFTCGSNIKNYSYVYDASGNIQIISIGGIQQVKYYYDISNELIREDNVNLNATITYAYDTNGNMLTKTLYPYTTGSLGTPSTTKTSQYSNNQLIVFDGKTVSYDTNGKLQTYDGSTFEWDNNKLSGISNTNNTIDYQYNAAGIRTSKTVNNVTTTYTLDSNNRLINETCGTAALAFFYGSNNLLAYLTINGTPYYYEKNVQGDIIGLVDGTNNEVVTYSYDSWGKLFGIGGALAATVGVMNPFRYRGYYYDTETQLYYLQSRYYNPDWGRFLSADDPSYQAGTTNIEANLYVYCGNNIINFIDSSGLLSVDQRTGLWDNSGSISYSIGITSDFISGYENPKNAWARIDITSSSVYVIKLEIEGVTCGEYFINGTGNRKQEANKFVYGYVNNPKTGTTYFLNYKSSNKYFNTNNDMAACFVHMHINLTLKRGARKWTVGLGGTLNIYFINHGVVFAGYNP